MIDWRGIPEEYRNKIVTGDCIDLMGKLPEESIGVILTSPPYNVGLNYEGFDDNLEHDRFVEFNGEWLKVAFRTMQESARIYIVVKDDMRYWMRPIAEEVGFKWVQDLVWCKPNLAGGSGVIKGDWHYMTEQILLLRKGKGTPMLSSSISNCFSWQVATTPQTNFREKRVHPAQMPIKLCTRLLSRTPGQVVFDPFAGSGSVLVAAKMLGRSFLGFDIVESVVDKANERLRTTTPPLFVVQPEQLDLMP